MQKKSLVIAYVPVLHRSYQEFFQKFAGAKLLILTRADLMQVSQLEYLKKDLRSLSKELLLAAIESWQIFASVKIANLTDLEKIDPANYKKIVLTNDDIGQFLANRYFIRAKNLEMSQFFLRWDKNSIEQARPIDQTIRVSKNDFEKGIMLQAFAQMKLSADWWRQVGALIFKDEKILLRAYNQHLPINDQVNRVGDPRVNYQSGEGIEFASSIHAEAALIAEAAKKGLALAGASLYVTTFPCPICAKQIAVSGIKKLFYATGYSRLDGLEILSSYGIEIIQVSLSPEELLDLQKEQSQFSQAKECYVLA